MNVLSRFFGAASEPSEADLRLSLGASRRELTLLDSHQLDVQRAESLYRAKGFTCGQRFVPERRMTPAEANKATPAARRRELISAAVPPSNTYDPSAELDLTGADGEPQFRLAAMHPGAPQCPSVDLQASGLVAVLCRARIVPAPPGSVMTGYNISNPLVESYGAPIDESLPRGALPPLAIGRGSTGETMLLFAAADLPEGSARVLRVETDADGVDTVVPDHDVRLLPLPCADSVDRWEDRKCELHQLPANLADVAAPRSKNDLIDQVASWIKANYKPLDDAKAPATKGILFGELHTVCCTVNSMSADYFTARQFSRAVDAVGWVQRRRANDGLRLMIARKGGEMTALERVSVADIDPAELAAFRAWQKLQNTPERRARKAAEQAEKERKAAEAAEHYRRWGSRSQAEIREICREYQQREAERAHACRKDGEPFVAMPSAWHGVPPEGPVPSYAERLRAFRAERAERGGA